MGYVYLALTILFTIYGQLILKWRIGFYGAFPQGSFEKLMYFKHVLLDFWVISGFLSAFIASLAWMATLTKFELSYAYPFMSLAFVLVFFLSALFFHEAITWQKLIGLGLVIGGLIIISKK